MAKALREIVPLNEIRMHSTRPTRKMSPEEISRMREQVVRAKEKLTHKNYNTEDTQRLDELSKKKKKEPYDCDPYGYRRAVGINPKTGEKGSYVYPLCTPKKDR